MQVPFSEAMLLGLPEIIFTNYTWLEQTRPWSAEAKNECSGCLIGAALYSVGRRSMAGFSPAHIQLELESRWPWLARVFVWYCPRCWKGYPGVMSFATHLAQYYQEGLASAEEIAGIFRKLEEKYDPSFAPPSAAGPAVPLPLVEAAK